MAKGFGKSQKTEDQRFDKICRSGFVKVQQHLERAGGMGSLYQGRIVGIENAITAFLLKETSEDISNFVFSINNGVSRKEADNFADSVLNKECKMMKVNPDSFVAIANTPFGAYVSFCGSRK